MSLAFAMVASYGTRISGFFVLLLLPLLLGFYANRLEQRLSRIACIAGGTFALPGRRGVWNINNILSITIAIGDFSFATAKTIDIAWDLTVGRGGQLLLSWIAFKIFWDAITHILTTGGISCNTYAALAFDTDSLQTILRLLADFARFRFPKTWFALYAYTVMILTSTFIILFPTIASAMTSYGTISNAMVEVKNVNVPFREFKECWGAVMDGSRVGLSDGYLISWSEFQQSLPTDSTLSAQINLRTYHNRYSKNYTECSSACLMSPAAYSVPAHRIVSDAPQLMYESNITLLFQNTSRVHHIPAPLLNLKAFPHPNNKASAWCYNGTVYGIEELPPVARCEPTLRYSWGFSFLLLFILSITSSIVAIMLYVLHLATQHQEDADLRRKRGMHWWRAVTDLSQVAVSQENHDVYEWDTHKLKDAMKHTQICLTDGGCGQTLPAVPRNSIAMSSGHSYRILHDDL